MCAHAVENDRGRLKIEPVFILMLSVYYYYIINIFNAFTTSTISKISNYSLSVRGEFKNVCPFVSSFLTAFNLARRRALAANENNDNS